MNFFADHCVPVSIIDRLRSENHTVLILKNYLPTDAPDDQVLEKAGELDTILLSLNGDFADLTRYPPSEYSGIIGLQVRNRPQAISSILDRLVNYLSAYPTQKYYTGRLLLVEPHRIRIRT